MKQIAGIYDGEVIRPAGPLAVPPNSPVLITIAGKERLEGEDLLDFLDRQGRLASRPTLGGDSGPPVRRVEVKGSPVSQTIIEDRGEI